MELKVNKTEKYISITDSTLNTLYIYPSNSDSDNAKDRFIEWRDSDYNPYQMLSYNNQNEIDGGLNRRLRYIV